jgi:hypothetical protein
MNAEKHECSLLTVVSDAGSTPAASTNVASVPGASCMHTPHPRGTVYIRGTRHARTHAENVANDQLNALSRVVENTQQNTQLGTLRLKSAGDLMSNHKNKRELHPGEPRPTLMTAAHESFYGAHRASPCVPVCDRPIALIRSDNREGSTSLTAISSRSSLRKAMT